MPEVARCDLFCKKVFALIAHLVVFLFCSLEKIGHNSGGKYECVFLTEPVVKQTIEVKSELTNSSKRSCLICYLSSPLLLTVGV